VGQAGNTASAINWSRQSVINGKKMDTKNNNLKCRWRVKDTAFSSWRNFPGLHTATEIWQMRQEGRFADAQHSLETQPIESPPDE
jgi:hypothetical protein